MTPLSRPIIAARIFDGGAASALARARLTRSCAWVMATASASAASGLSGRALGSRNLTISATCAFSAWPLPTTVFLMRLAEYSQTSRPARAGATSATPRAWPSFSADCGSQLTKVSSTAASTGSRSAMTPSSPSCSRRRRSASERPTRECTLPQATKASFEPETSMTPQPMLRSPGSMPMMRIAASSMRRV